MASLFTQKKLLLAVSLVLGIWISQSWSRSLPEASLIEKHELWMAQYGLVYKDSAEKAMRFKIFKENLEYVESVNSEGRPYKLGLNAFADLTNEEFRASKNGYKRSLISSGTKSFRYENVTAVPSTMDWRKKGAVTPVKDQGQCGKD